MFAVVVVVDEDGDDEGGRTPFFLCSDCSGAAKVTDCFGGALGEL